MIGKGREPLLRRAVNTAMRLKLLEAVRVVYPQVATHNAHTLAAAYYMAGRNYYPGHYEFQCLHGMAKPLPIFTGQVSAALAAGGNASLMMVGSKLSLVVRVICGRGPQPKKGYGPTELD